MKILLIVSIFTTVFLFIHESSAHQKPAELKILQEDAIGLLLKDLSPKQKLSFKNIRELYKISKSLGDSEDLEDLSKKWCNYAIEIEDDILLGIVGQIQILLASDQDYTNQLVNDLIDLIDKNDRKFAICLYLITYSLDFTGDFETRNFLLSSIGDRDWSILYEEYQPTEYRGNDQMTWFESSYDSIDIYKKQFLIPKIQHYSENIPNNKTNEFIIYLLFLILVILFVLFYIKKRKYAYILLILTIAIVYFSFNKNKATPNVNKSQKEVKTDHEKVLIERDIRNDKKSHLARDRKVLHQNHGTYYLYGLAYDKDKLKKEVLTILQNFDPNDFQSKEEATGYLLELGSNIYGLQPKLYNDFLDLLRELSIESVDQSRLYSDLFLYYYGIINLDFEISHANKEHLQDMHEKLFLKNSKISLNDQIQFEIGLSHLFKHDYEFKLSLSEIKSHPSMLSDNISLNSLLIQRFQLDSSMEISFFDSFKKNRNIIDFDLLRGELIIIDRLKKSNNSIEVRNVEFNKLIDLAINQANRGDDEMVHFLMSAAVTRQLPTESKMKLLHYLDDAMEDGDPKRNFLKKFK